MWGKGWGGAHGDTGHKCSGPQRRSLSAPLPMYDFLQLEFTTNIRFTLLHNPIILSRVTSHEENHDGRFITDPGADDRVITFRTEVRFINNTGFCWGRAFLACMQVDATHASPPPPPPPPRTLGCNAQPLGCNAQLLVDDDVTAARHSHCCTANSLRT